VIGPVFFARSYTVTSPLFLPSEELVMSTEICLLKFVNKESSEAAFQYNLIVLANSRNV
jgi:hypothetical protein